MEAMQWFLLGVLFTLSVLAFAYISVRVQAPWYAWTVLIGGAFLVLFGLAWAGSSFAEDIPTSGAMALFGRGLVPVRGWRNTRPGRRCPGPTAVWPSATSLDHCVGRPGRRAGP